MRDGIRSFGNLIDGKWDYPENLPIYSAVTFKDYTNLFMHALFHRGYMTIDPIDRTLRIPNRSTKRHLCKMMLSGHIFSRMTFQSNIVDSQFFVNSLQSGVLDRIKRERAPIDFQGLIASAFDLSVLSREEQTREATL